MSGPNGATLINNILQAARKTFARVVVRPEECVLRPALPQDEFVQHLAQLRHLVAKVKATDLGLERSRALNRDTRDGLSNSRSAPVTYIGIYEDRDISVGIFIIRRGCRIPLHNHPGMHGILKVVHGHINVASYTKVNPEQVQFPEGLKQRLQLIEPDRVFPARKQFFSAGINSASLLLRPEEHNFHEIEAGPESSAAFLDILAPPYNQHDEEDLFPNDQKRDCDFYREIRNSSYTIHSMEGDTTTSGQTITWLEKQGDAPEDYFCDSEEFLVRL